MSPLKTEAQKTAKRRAAMPRRASKKGKDVHGGGKAGMWYRKS